MAGNRKQVRIQICNGNFTRRLGSIRMKKSAVIVSDLSQLRNRLDRPYLVVGMYYRPNGSADLAG